MQDKKFNKNRWELTRQPLFQPIIINQGYSINLLIQNSIKRTIAFLLVESTALLYQTVSQINLIAD